MSEANNHCSDEELMEIYQAGSFAACEILYGRHSGRVYEYLKKKSSPETARDLLQETFLRLHRARGQYSTQYPFLPWLFTISRNALFDHLRLNETKVSHHSSAEPLVSLAGSIEEAGSSGPEINLAGLPEKQRRAIELRYLNDWSFEKIADEMKTSPLNVRQLVSRGLKKVRSGFGGST